MISIETGAGGRVYQIWKQHQASSCGVASAWMARGIARQMSFAEEEWDLAQRMYLGAVNSTIGAASTIPDAPMTIDPRAYSNVPANQIQNSFTSNFALGGLTCTQLANALRSERLQVNVVHNNGAPTPVVANNIAYNKPAISFIKWPDRVQPGDGGAHFVVVGRCTPSRVSFLDPWTGHINEEPNDGRFRASYNSGNILMNIYISA